MYELDRDAEALEAVETYLELHPYSDQRDLGYLVKGRLLNRLGHAVKARAAFRSVAAVPGARAPCRLAAARELRVPAGS